MIGRRIIGLALTVIVCGSAMAMGATAPDEKPAAPGEWGFRPFEGAVTEMNPPAVVWRPQKDAASYDFECARDEQFKQLVYSAKAINYNCLCPDKPFEPGKHFWRFRFTDKKGDLSAWSTTRTFEIAKDAIVFPMPPRAELIGRIPTEHPRLFVRPEQLPRMKELAKGELKPQFDRLIKECEAILKNPPPTAEPPKYPPGTTTKSEEWREIWWGNRVYTIKVLDSAATLGFAYRLTGNKDYAQLGKKLLMDAAQWDPKGSTNFRYNDEAGMPYAYYFARAYTFLNDVLSDQDKAKCREVALFRGAEMHKFLRGKMLWTPYDSHANRGWHKLTELGIAFLGEIPEAQDWVWFGMSYFYNIYPVWCDADGAWHEGVSYWDSYIRRFSYFADVMRVAMNINAFQKPYFSRAGYYAMYMQPPGTPGGGFGDLVTERTAASNHPVMVTLAAQAQNPYWQWYVDRIAPAATAGKSKDNKKAPPIPTVSQAGASTMAATEGGYIGFVRGMLPKVAPKPPADLPTSRVFRGTGQAYLNSTLLDAKDNVELGFKSSPMGAVSHGYDSNNTFFLYAYGQRLFASTGRRDIYGSDHHKNWMWETKSTNGILVNGKGQSPTHSALCTGKIIGFGASSTVDYVAGDASTAYGDALKKFERHAIFLKPQTIVIWDRLEAPKPSTFDWLLHSPVEIKAADPADINVTSGDVAARVALLWPLGLEVSVTDQFDPAPRARIKGPDGKPLKEWHLSARSKPAQTLEFVTVIKVSKDNPAPFSAKLTESAAGLNVDIPSLAKLQLHNTGSINITTPDGKTMAIEDGKFK